MASSVVVGVCVAEPIFSAFRAALITFFYMRVCFWVVDAAVRRSLSADPLLRAIAAAAKDNSRETLSSFLSRLPLHFVL